MVILNEAKQVGILYHVTDIDGFNGILHSNKLGKYKNSSISFTRDPRYTYVSGTEKYFVIQLVIDGNKLSSRYKITPFASQDSYVNGKRFEAEERVEGQIQDIGKYTLEIKPLRKDFDYGKFIGKMEYFKFLKKYPQIKDSVFPLIKNPLEIEKEIQGIYKNGKRIKPFTRDDGAEVCWKFFGLDKKYAGDEWLEGSYFSSFDPSYSVTSDELKGYDLIWLGNDGETIYVRAKNPNQYSELKAFGKLKVEPYIHPFESQGEKDYE